MSTNSPSRRDYDVVVLGASGHTGQLIAMYLDVHPEQPRFAIAGRSEASLAEIKQRLRLKDSVGILVVDTHNKTALETVASRTHVIINAVGPYQRLGGVKVVQACVKAGTHYTDASAESEFSAKIIKNFHSKAEEAKVKIVLTAAFACLPMDLAATLSVRKLVQLTSKPPSGRIRSQKAQTSNPSHNILVDCGFSLPGVVSSGTLFTALSIATDAPKTLKSQGSEWLTPSSSYTGAPVTAYYDQDVDKLAFPGATSLPHKGLGEFALLPYGWLASLSTWIAAGFVWLLIRSSLLRWIITKVASALPRHAPQSLEGYTKESVKVSALATAVGSKDVQGKPVRAVCRIEAANQDMYVLSAVTMAETALTFIAAPKMEHPGGVLTPSLIGVDTLVERLTKFGGLRFQVEAFSDEDV
ncbi:uncharacterized protein UTRI_00063 [Ustilago trichophora]|uniref:Saccharopine dehydrogenase NADP binding domain-containing protein n=1 Tax=Ustilago trichophora TaxID=86804 RepID=A0A5C3DT67_9BASI|nr:uncharacterized protein UTRI_00063 [Ustilago trichophora]